MNDYYKDVCEEPDNYGDPSNNRIIRGKPLFYTTGQVAEQIGEPDSTIRFWCDEFDEFLQIQKTGKSGRRRQFTETDIKKIEYIRYLLKKESLSVKQVKEFLSTPEAEKMLPIAKEKDQLLIEALSNAVTSFVEDAVEKKLDEFKESLLETAKIQADSQRKLLEEFQKEQEDTRKQMRSDLHNERGKTTTEVTQILKSSGQKYAEQLMETKNIIKQLLDEKDKSFSEREKELTNQIKDLQEVVKELSEQKQKGFFSRIFKK